MLKKGMFAILAMVGCLAGCGEVTELALSIRPSRLSFRPLKPPDRGWLLTPGCHLTLTGDFKLDPDDNTAANLDEEYQLAKGFVDLDDPDASILVRVGLKGDPAAESHRFLCFENADACAYRKVDAWLRAVEPGDPSIDDIDCEPIKDACNTI